jgi:hypothetical protein
MPPDDILELFDEDVLDSKEQWNERMDRARKWPWKASDHGAIAAWLRQNEKPLAVAIEASKRPEYFNPLVSNLDYFNPGVSNLRNPRGPRLIGAPLPNVQKCRDVVNQLRCRAMRRVADGDFDGAWQDLMACQRLGRLIMRGSGSLIEHLVGIALVAVATDGQVMLLGFSKASSTQTLRWLDDLQRLPRLARLTNNFDVGERFSVLDALQGIATGGIEQLELLEGRPGAAPAPDPFWNRLFTRSIDWDPAFRNTNRFFDDLSTATKLDDSNSRKQEFTKISEEIRQRRQSAVGFVGLGAITLGKSERGEKIGDILLAMLLHTIERIQAANDRTEQQQLNLQVAFALAAYQADHDRYPARLDELVPKYLTKVPGDLFSGKPLFYRPNGGGYLLYSVGVNGEDEDGRWTDDEPKGDDLRLQMPVPEPKPKKRAE